MLMHSTSKSLFTAAVFSWIGDRLLENTVSRMGSNEGERRKFLDAQFARKRSIFDLVDPYAALSTAKEEEKPKATDEDKEKYLEALNNPAGFKSLADIKAAIFRLNETIETLREQE